MTRLGTILAKKILSENNDREAQLNREIEKHQKSIDLFVKTLKDSSKLPPEHVNSIGAALVQVQGQQKRLKDELKALKGSK
jgi:hypothetical protein